MWRRRAHEPSPLRFASLAPEARNSHRFQLCLPRGVPRTLDSGLYTAAQFPHGQALFRLGLALGLGLFVGLEREWRQKDAGLRTFGFAALLGALGGVSGESYALVSLILLGVLLSLMNWQVIRRGDKAELTTSAALLVTGYVGVL